MRILYSPEGGHSFTTSSNSAENNENLPAEEPVVEELVEEPVVEEVVEEPVVEEVIEEEVVVNHSLAEHGIELDDECMNILNDALEYLRGQNLSGHDNLRKALLTGFPMRKYNKIVACGVTSRMIETLI